MYAELFSPGLVHYFDLEDPVSLAQMENPKLTLGPLQGLIVIDEIQHLPDLFKLIRVLVDKENLRHPHICFVYTNTIKYTIS